MGKIFNFDLKKQLQLVKDLEVIHSKNQTKQTQINFIFLKKQKMLKEQQPQTYCHVKHTTQTPEIKKKKI